MSSTYTTIHIDQHGAKRLRVCFKVMNGKILKRAVACVYCHKFYICSSTKRVLVDGVRFKNVCPHCIPLLPSVWLPNCK